MGVTSRTAPADFLFKCHIRKSCYQMRPGPVLGEKPPGLVPVRDGTKFVCPRREAKPQDILCPQRRFLYRRTQEAPQGPLQFPIRGPAGQAFFPNSNITLPMDAELEISAEAGNFVPLILLDIPQHRKSQNRIFFAVSPVFSPTNFRANFWKENRTKIDTESCPSGRRCSTRNSP